MNSSGSSRRSVAPLYQPRDALELRNLIAHLSRVSAFIGTNWTLAARLGRSLKTVSRYLNWLEGEGHIVRRTKELYWRRFENEADFDEDDLERRVIYIVAKRDDDEGALQVSHLTRRYGRQKHETDDDRYCGRLQCTPEQFDHWLQLAGKRGWVKIGISKDGSRVIKAAANLPKVRLPSTFTKRITSGRKVRYAFDPGGARVEPVRQVLIAILDGQLKTRGFVGLTDDQLRNHPWMPSKTARSNVQEKLKALFDEGRYFKYPLPKGFGRGRLIFSEPTGADLLPSYAAMAFPGRLKRQPKRRRGRPRSAGPRLRVGDVQRRLAELAPLSGRRISSARVTRAEIAATVRALGLAGPRDPGVALDLVASHLLAAQQLPPPGPFSPAPTPAVTGPTINFELIDPYTKAKTVVGDGGNPEESPPAPASGATPQPDQAEENEVSGMTADGRIRIVMIDPVTGIKTVTE